MLQRDVNEKYLFWLIFPSYVKLDFLNVAFIIKYNKEEKERIKNCIKII